MDENQTEQPDENGNGDKAPDTEQVMAVVVMIAEPELDRVRLELRPRLDMTPAQRVDFFNSLIQMCAIGQAKARREERMQPQIQVPQIQLPPGMNLRSRGKGRGR
jgi:hypothetical protein